MGDWEHFTKSEEQSNYDLCIGTAASHGISSEIAETCEQGKELCSDCPFVNRKGEFIG
jgi:hypothetical protein